MRRVIIFVSGVTGIIKVTKRTVKLFVNQCECFVSNVSYEMIVQRDSRKVKHVLRSKSTAKTNSRQPEAPSKKA